MSTDIHLDSADEISLNDVALILTERIGVKFLKTTGHLIQGEFNGGVASISHPSERIQQLADELYGVVPKTIIGFRVAKFVPYELSYGNILDGIIALVKATHKDAIAAVEDRPFLRRLNGQITLFNEGGLFNANVVPQWRPRFDFEHAFKEKFER